MGEDPVKSKTTRAYYNAFSSGDGAVVLGDLYRCSHDEYDPDPQQTAFREGQRSVVIMIKALMAEGMLTKSEPSKDGVDLSTPTFTG